MSLSQPAASHFGEQRRFQLPGITLSQVHTENYQREVGWHHHENPHLTFILQGEVIEGTQKKVYNCSAGNLLFHGRFEPHYNVKRDGNARCLHIEISPGCLNDLAHDENRLQGIFDVNDPRIKFLCYKLFREALISDDVSALSIQSLALEVFGQLLFSEATARASRPLWVSKLEEILRSAYTEKYSLDDLAGEVSIHPVHLSRSFSRYFHCTLGEYVRSLRVERSLAFMSSRNLSLTEIASSCGFADQSHFFRSFRQIMGVNPSTYRKILSH